MNETSQNILTAQQGITELQEQQLAWAESSPEAADALHKVAPAPYSMSRRG